MKKFINILTLILASTFNLAIALAQEVNKRDLLPEIGTGNANDKILPTGDLKYEILPRLIKIFLSISGAITTGVFVYAGVMLLTHMGNEEVITKFKKALMFSGIGLVLILTAYGIVYGILKLQF